MIPVSKPFLPPKNEYYKLIDQVWNRNWLTNNGPLVNELELKLKKHLNLDHLLFTTNGTIALQLAIQGLDLKGEIITTPFSYVATTSSIVWENCTPVFADIDPKRLTIDPEKIKSLICEKTSAILATHVFGIPCHIEEIEAIAKENGLKVIYDGAQAFGTLYRNKSLLDYGDICTLSTHATKLFHTIEGGAVISKSADVLKKMAYMRNFGHSGAEKFEGIGINGKNSEFHAAMGLTNLAYIDDILRNRQVLCAQYDNWLLGKGIQRPEIPLDTSYNYSYYPVIFESEKIALNVFQNLLRQEIFARRYFYPSLSSLSYTGQQATPVSDDIASRILCLPLYHDLSSVEVDMICRIVIRTLKYN